LYEYAIRNAVNQHDLETTEGRLAALDAAAPIVANIKDLGLRKRYAVNLDRWLGLLDEEFVLARVSEHSGHGAGRAAAQGSARTREPAGSRPGGPAGGGPPGPAGNGAGQGAWRGARAGR
jgi:DNA primase